MTAGFQRIDLSSVQPEHDGPAADRIVDGNPRFTTWNLEERDGLYCGVWESTPGAWRIAYDEWEYCCILAGHSVIEEEGGARHELKTGDRFIIRPGFRGVWRVIETTRKVYVIRL